MKPTTLLAFSLLLTGSLTAQQPSKTEKPQAQVTFHVVTDDGKPVANVDVIASTFLYLKRDEGFGQDINKQIKGRTDEDGFTTITFPSEHGDLHYSIYDVPGFYPTWNLEYQFKEIKDGKWQPWNPTLEIEFKPILNPIPMYGRKVGYVTKFVELPQKNRPIGFDLIVGDWVAPYGAGKVSDMIFTLTEKVPFVSVEKPYDVTFAIAFSNKGDGIQSILASRNRGSDLHLPRYAPEDGYEPKLVKQMGRPLKEAAINRTSRESQNYFIRIRTVLDENGKIKSALYGKVIGDIACDIINSKNGFIQFAYCLNPNSNDRNMEFDPKRNLVGDIPFAERVTEP